MYLVGYLYEDNITNLKLFFKSTCCLFHPIPDKMPSHLSTDTPNETVFTVITTLQSHNFYIIIILKVGRDSVVGIAIRWLATGWTVRGSNQGGGEIFRTRPDQPWGPPNIPENV